MGQGRLDSVEIGREVRTFLVIAGVASGLSRLSDLSGFAGGFRQQGQVHRVVILNSPRGENWVIVSCLSDERQRRREAFIAECEFACRGNGSRLCAGGDEALARADIQLGCNAAAGRRRQGKALDRLNARRDLLRAQPGQR